MYLQEAIVKLLIESGCAISTPEIADALNKNKWYVKKDKSKITDFQIHGRTKNYTELFDRQGAMVNLKGNGFNNLETKSHKVVHTRSTKSVLEENISEELAIKILMNEQNFRSASEIDSKVSSKPGFYCIRIENTNALPSPFCDYLRERQHNILYIGIASKSLHKRFLRQELRAKGNGTFFRGIGALLGFRPPIGSLVNKKNKRNYKFSNPDKHEIINWINDHLIVSWVEYSGDHETIETQLIQTHLPLLNTDKNPSKLKELAELRNECRKIAMLDWAKTTLPHEQFHRK